MAGVRTPARPADRRGTGAARALRDAHGPPRAQASPAVPESLVMEDVRAAHQELEDSTHTGKILLSL